MNHLQAIIEEVHETQKDTAAAIAKYQEAVENLVEKARAVGIMPR